MVKIKTLPKIVQDCYHGAIPRKRMVKGLGEVIERLHYDDLCDIFLNNYQQAQGMLGDDNIIYIYRQAENMYHFERYAL